MDREISELAARLPVKVVIDQFARSITIISGFPHIGKVLVFTLGERCWGGKRGLRSRRVRLGRGGK